jgi:phosphotransferase system HPr-like phosphotransfer protein
MKKNKTPNANKRMNIMNITIASESSLAMDWLKQEEDEAWQDLQKIVFSFTQHLKAKGE